VETLNNEIKKLIKIEGKVIGEVFKTDAEYILEKKGEKGLERVQKETEKLGYPIDYQKIKSTDWYPIGLRVISLLAIRRAFGWGGKEIEEMGEAAPKISFITKMFLRTFFSPEMVARAASRIWPRHYSIGRLKITDFKEEKKNHFLKGSCRIQLENFKVHPILCTYLGGYFLGIARLSGVLKEVSCKEVKCPFKGDQYHLYLMNWIRYE
jgi:hypothetical protein